MKIRLKAPQKIIQILLITLLLGGAAFGGYFYRGKIGFRKTNQSQQENKYISFVSEVYDKIKENHWEKIDDKGLISTFLLAAEKITDQPQILKEETKENLEKKIEEILDLYESEEKQKEFVAQLADVVLANLKPFGRSRLYVKKDEIALKKQVTNQTDTDYYQILGVEKDASQEEINQAIEQKESELQGDNSEEAQKALKTIAQAEKTLGDQASKELYDQAGIEPTVDYRLLTPNIFYLHLTKFSPTTLDDLKRATEKVDGYGPELDTLIFDLRDNIGGAIDGLPYFLGPFIGNNQYAYQFFHQGEEEDFKTKIGWLPSLVRYKKVIILINENSQSSAEVMVASLKKYNVGVLVGRTTKGWGTVEKVFKLDSQIDENEEYSLFLVHRLTLREDSQPIEGNGVEPMISIDNPDWKKELSAYFDDQSIVDEVGKLFE